MKLLRLNNSIDDLVKRCRAHDRKAQHELYERLAPVMLGVCMRYVKSKEEGEEVLMNGFVKVFNKIEDFRNEGPFEGWVRRIMARESLNYIRYQKNLFVEHDEDQLAEPEYSPIESEETSAALMKLINGLPLGNRTVFNLFAIEGYSHREIAVMLNIDENTSRTQLSRARQQLREQITVAQYLYKP